MIVELFFFIAIREKSRCRARVSIAVDSVAKASPHVVVFSQPGLAEVSIMTSYVVAIEEHTEEQEISIAQRDDAARPAAEKVNN